MRGPRGPKKGLKTASLFSLLEMWFNLPNRVALWYCDPSHIKKDDVQRMTVMLPMTSTHCIHPTSDNPLLGEYSLPCPFPPKTLPTSSFFLPIQCNIALKINPKRYFKLMFFCNLVWISFFNTCMPFLQWNGNELACQFPKYTKYFCKARPPSALVMLIVSEAKMGQEGEEEVHNKHIQNRRWKLAPCFCHFSMAS